MGRSSWGGIQLSVLSIHTHERQTLMIFMKVPVSRLSEARLPIPRFRVLPFVIVLLLWVVTGLMLWIKTEPVGIQHRLLQLGFRRIGQWEEEVAVLLLSVLAGEGFLRHGHKQSFPAIHDLQPFDHKHPGQGNRGNGLYIPNLDHAVNARLNVHSFHS